MRLATGSYTGNGTSQTITVSAFSPSIVWVRQATATQPCLRIPAFTGSDSHKFGTGIITTGITAIGANSFSVGSDASVNSVATYHWFALGADSAVVTSGEYTGTGADDRDVTGLSFTPDYVLCFAKVGGVTVAVWHQFKGGDNAIFFPGSTVGANRIQGVGSNSFQVGTTLNTLNVVYAFLCFKDTTSNVDLSSYTGDGAASKTVTTPFQYQWMHISPFHATDVEGPYKQDTLAATESWISQNNNLATNRITAMGATSFTADSLINTNAQTYYTFGMRDLVPTSPPPTPVFPGGNFPTGAFFEFEDATGYARFKTHSTIHAELNNARML